MTYVDDSPRRIRHAPTGRLFTQNGLSVPVSITTRADDVLLVILEGGEDLTASPLNYLMLESTGSRGVVRTAGSAELIESNLLRFALNDGPEVVQRRAYVRVVAAKRAVLEDEEGELLADALTVDISGGGVLIQLPRSAEVPTVDRVHFTIYLGMTDYDDQVTGWGHVVRSTPEHRIALAFDHITSADQQRLIRFVFERQRLALRLTRGD